MSQSKQDNSDRTSQIRTINNDPSLSKADKTKAIQRLLLGSNEEICFPAKRSNEESNCPHYEKKCSRFKFKCCDTIDPCVRCHLEKNGIICGDPTGVVAREQVIEITCNECELVQPPFNKFCQGCEIELAPFFCKICKIWTTSEIMHCDSCGVCRLGNTSKVFHCDTCGICFHGSRNDHECNTKANHRDNVCGVCHERTFCSREPSTTFPCGHIMHLACAKRLVASNQYKCPTCKKSLVNMEPYWKKRRYLIRNKPMPKLLNFLTVKDVVKSEYGRFRVLRGMNTSSFPEIIKNEEIYEGELLDWKMSNGKLALGYIKGSNLKVEFIKKIYCNDCEKKSDAKYHFEGTECEYCGSFNTQS